MATSIGISSESSESASEDEEVNFHLLPSDNATEYGTTTKNAVISEAGADVDEEQSLGLLKDAGDKRSFAVASIIAVLLLGMTSFSKICLPLLLIFNRRIHWQRRLDFGDRCRASNIVRF